MKKDEGDARQPALREAAACSESTGGQYCGTSRDLLAMMLERAPLLRRSRRWLRARLGHNVLKSSGHCPTCGQKTTFVARNTWLRDSFLCVHCGSLPRERALMAVLEDLFPDWRRQRIHESSPADRGASRRLAAECGQYLPTQYFPDVAPGTTRNGVRCESLDALTFPDESFDLHITQDVLEHVFHPDRVLREIARTLAAGGAHVCTVPLVNKDKPSRRRASIDAGGNVVHIEPAQYHGNPVSEQGSLVTMDWGHDLCDFALRTSGLQTTIVRIDDLSRGIRAEYIDVLVMRKPENAALRHPLKA